ncbi:cytidylyltransferase domain-containing protein [Malaciobacter canalis]|uniref:cytidylyltransferase domain-containing protein n=1 Tax=Malaciobacter canalis TaxID=1912871 RepID=UPI00384E2E0D
MKNNLFIIIQARMTSTRLPKKVLLPLCGKTVLEVVIERLNKYKDNIIIATTDDGSENPILELCKKIDVKVSKGSVNNVLSRYYHSAKEFAATKKDIIVRITSDCPLIDCTMMEKVIDMYINGDYDYVSNRINRTVPVGLDVEVFSFELLEYMYINAKEDFEKEHVTPYIYLSHKDSYKIGSFEENKDNSTYRLTLDEQKDYEAIQEVYKKFNNQTDFSYKDLITMLEKNSYISKINESVKQKQVKE